MTSDITPSLIFNVLSKETSTGELQPLQEDFFDKAEEYLEKNSKSGDMDMQQNNNFKKMLAKLKERRKQKLLVYLAYDKPLPKPVPKNEEKMYEKVQKIINGTPSEQSIAKIKISEEIPEIITPQGKHIGPFKKGELVDIDDSAEEAFIINSKIGEKM